MQACAAHLETEFMQWVVIAGTALVSLVTMFRRY